MLTAATKSTTFGADVRSLRFSRPTPVAMQLLGCLRSVTNRWNDPEISETKRQRPDGIDGHGIDEGDIGAMLSSH